MAHKTKPHIEPSLLGKNIGQTIDDGSIVGGREVIGNWEWNGKKWIDITPKPRVDDYYQRDLGPVIPIGDGGNLSFVQKSDAAYGIPLNPVTVMDNTSVYDLGDGLQIQSQGGEVVFIPGEGFSKGLPGTKSDKINKQQIASVDLNTSQGITQISQNLFNTYDNDITVTIQSVPTGGDIIVNGESTKLTTNNILKFRGKELLTPKIFELEKGGRKSKDIYKVYTVKRQILQPIKPVDGYNDIGPNNGRGVGIEIASSNLNERNLGVQNLQTSKNFGNVAFDFFQVRVEKNGKEIVVNNQINPLTETPNPNVAVTLNFKLISQTDGDGDSGDVIIKDPPKPVVTSLKIISDIAKDGDFAYITSWGDKGELLDEDEIVLFAKLDVDVIPYVDIKSRGPRDFTHTTKYEIQKPSSKAIQTIETLETRIQLEPGENIVNLSSVKIPKEEIYKPLINVLFDNVKVNVSSKEPVKIPYETKYADEVSYTLGKTQRVLKPSGTLVLDAKDFYNGVGSYIIYLQPNSSKAGSGDVKRITVNVINKEYLPGPDITNINYPQNIKGADFKGFDIPFNINWQSKNTNFIYIYAGKYSKDTKSNFLGKFGPSGKASFNVADVIRLSGINITEASNVVQFGLSLIPFNTEGDSETQGKVENIFITFDKGDLTLKREPVINDIKEAFRKQFDKSIFEDVSPFLTHYLHLGGGNNKLIATWDVDKNTLSTFQYDEETNTTKKTDEQRSIVLKLYEPLGQDIGVNDKIWISKIQSIPLIDTLTIIDGETAECTPLTPNFDLDVGDDIGYQILDDLIASGSTSSNDVINQFISSSDFDLSNLSISYVTSSTVITETQNGKIIEDTGVYGYNWPEIVKYSSAEERSANFLYKVKLIQSYETKYNSLISGSATTGSVSIRNEKDRTLGKINDVKKTFDSFEKFLYTSSSIDGLTYPGAGGNSLSASTDLSVTSWYNGLLSSAQTYDINNKSRFVNNLPEHIQNDNNSSEFILFFDMVGQHFDNIWSHINAITKSKKAENKYNKGIVDDLVYHMLESLGWDADMGVKSQLLWEYAFGKHSDGTVVSSMSGKDRQHEIWRRILNNLPYLNKHKGTKRALSAALSIYGIPNSMLTIMEFGGPKDPSSTKATTKFTYEDRTASINMVSGSFIEVPWKKYNNGYSNDYPNSVEIRINTNQKQDQQIISASKWSLDIIPDTGSLAKIKLTVGAESASTNPMPIFNDEYTQIVVNRVSGSSSDVFEVFAKEGIQGRVRNQMSASLTATTKAWESGSEFYIGQTFTGSLDEFRLWRTPLSESKVDNHTLLPDGIDGNHISSSTIDLILRHDFEYPKNRGTDVYIKNVALTTSYSSFSTASNFESISSYPYNYTPYDRDVTAEIPQSGFNASNKVRFETQTTISDLSYRSRATKKTYDESPIDSNRLGLFFSPIKEINMDIMKSLGSFNIDNYIGNPSDEFEDEYTELRDLRNYYFDRYSLNINEYIQLVRYVDKSLFQVLESLVPARAKVASGLLIEPHILERSKVRRKPTTATSANYQSKIDTQEDIIISSSNHLIESFITASNDISLEGTKDNYLTTITASNNHILSGSKLDYLGIITQSDNIVTTGTILTNSGSDMGGISFKIDATVTQSIQGEYDSTQYQQIGMEPNSLTVAGFGLYGVDGNVIRTRLDKNNNFVKDRVKVFQIKESYTVDVPQNVNSLDSSLGTEPVTQTKHKFFVNILPFTGSNGLETSAPTGGNIVSATPLNGYFPYHYRNTGDLTTGMENSFFNGSKQTESTTLDGGSPVQTFTTNPNTLRVTDSQRGSGEPILEVD